MIRPGAHRRRALRFSVFLILTLLAGPGVGAQSAESGCILFVAGDPLMATLVLDEREIQGRTPLLLRDLEPGTYVLQIRKAGFSAATREIVLVSGTSTIVDIPLERESVLAAFPAETAVDVDDRPLVQPYLELPPGGYQLERESAGTLQIRSLYPRQRWIDSLNIMIPVFTAFTVAVMVSELVNPRADDAALSPFTMASFVVSAALIGTDIALHFDRRQYSQARTYRSMAVDPSRAAVLFQQAEDALQAGRLERALFEYGILLADHPESALYPEALYKSARIYLVLGQREQAAELLLRLAGEYPVAALYDRTCKTLAEIELQRKRYSRALSHLDRIVYADPVVTEQEIAVLRRRIEQAAEGRGKNSVLPGSR